MSQKSDESEWKVSKFYQPWVNDDIYRALVASSYFKSYYYQYLPLPFFNAEITLFITFPEEELGHICRTLNKTSTTQTSDLKYLKSVKVRNHLD